MSKERLADGGSDGMIGGMLSRKKFNQMLYAHYERNGRAMPWRENTSPYYVLVSEIMLQQTQVDRVRGKFVAFVREFPSFRALAEAPRADVLRAWQGLGYNRRALALQACAQKVVREYKGRLPRDPGKLKEFPGIGKATAASICVYAFNAPHVFIETNVRAVFLHFFFKDQEGVHDRNIEPLVQKMLDAENPRLWYWAVMDQGVTLKKLHKNPSRRSAHYARQPKFEGSSRQLRGAIVRALLEGGPAAPRRLADMLMRDEDEVAACVEGLVRDGIAAMKGGDVSIA